MLPKNKIGIIVIASFILFSVTNCSKIRYWGYATPNSNDLSQFISSIRPVSDDVEAKFRLAMHFQKRGKHKIAIEEFRKVIHMEPAHVKAYNAMGVSYDYLGHYDLAIESYNCALKLNANLDYVHNNIGYSHLLRGDLDSAVEAFKKAITLNNKNKKYHNNLGLAYARKGQVDLVFSEFKLAGSESRARYNLKQLSIDPALSKDFKQNVDQFLADNPSTDSLMERDGSSSIAFSSDAQFMDAERKKQKFVSKNSIADEKNRSLINTESDTARNTESPEHSDKKALEVASLNLLGEDVAKAVDKTLYTVQLGKFKNLSYAKKMTDKYINRGYHRLCISEVRNRKTYYIVRLGSFENKSEADKMALMIKKFYGIDAFTAVEDNFTEKISTYSKTTPSINSNTTTFNPDFRLEISNGNGVKYAARKVGSYLREKGFRVSQLTDASHFNFSESKIYYSSGHFQDALQLAQTIPGFQKFKNIIQFNIWFSI